MKLTGQIAALLAFLLLNTIVSSMTSATGRDMRDYTAHFLPTLIIGLLNVL